MDQLQNILVIGGGVIGVCTAYYLSQAGAPSITLIEKDDICAGSSYGNAGLIVPSHATPLAVPGVIGQVLPWLLDAASPFFIKPRLDLDLIDWLWRFYNATALSTVHRVTATLLELNRASLDLYRRLVDQEKLDFGLVDRGGLFLYQTAHGLDKGIHDALLLRDYGVGTALLDAASVRQLMPLAGPDIVGGIYYRGDAHLIPDRFVRGLAALVRQRGVVVQTDTEVIGLETAHDRVTRVITTRGDLHPDHVILATGAWTPSLARDLRLRLPVQSAKGYSITVPRPATFPELHLHLSERKIAVTPMADKLRFAGTLELAGLDLTINRKRIAAIDEGARAYLQRACWPFAASAGTREIWRGLRPLTPDSLPIIGPSPHHANLTVATGHGMLGISMGPITGKLVAQTLTGDRPDVDIAPLAVDRFR